MTPEERAARRREDILCRAAWIVGAVTTVFSVSAVVWAWLIGALG